MKIHCIRHEPFEGLAYIKKWIDTHNHSLTLTHVYMNQEFPDEAEADMLIIMGGASSVYDGKSWIEDEDRFLKKCIKKNISILGICFGAQMLARALGSKVYPGKTKEIGWFPIQHTTENQKYFPNVPQELEVFHWHGDTYDLPVDAERLSCSAVTPNQGFIYNQKMVGLQYHLEMTPDALQNIIIGAGSELEEEGEYIQPAGKILQKTSQLKATNDILVQILDYLSDQV